MYTSSLDINLYVSTPTSTSIFTYLLLNVATSSSRTNSWCITQRTIFSNVFCHLPPHFAVIFIAASVQICVRRSGLSVLCPDPGLPVSVLFSATAHASVHARACSADSGFRSLR
jgi:hypothetical protein